MPEETAPLYPFLPLVVGTITLVDWDGYSYVDDAGRTYWSGAADPTEADAIDAVTTPRARPAAPPSDAEIYAAQLALGYTDPVTSIALKTTEYAQSKFTSQLAGVRLGLALGQIYGSTPVTIWDANNQQHTLSADEFLALMFRLFVHCKQTFDTYAP